MYQKENQRIMISKKMMKDGLLSLLTKKDLNKISVSELCKVSSINRSTFYRHYDTPEDVWEDIVRDYSKELKTFLVKPNTIEDIQLSIDKLCEFIYQHSDVIRLSFRCHTSTDIANEIIEYIWQPFEEICDLKYLDEDTKHLTSTFVGYGMYHLFKQWIIDEVPKTPHEVAKILYEIMDMKSVIK